MYFDYFEALSGEPIRVDGVGHLRSPLVKDLYPLSGIGQEAYHFYLAFLSWDKDAIVKYDKLAGLRGAEKIASTKALSAFDAVTLLKPTRELCGEILSFFMLEDLVWDDGNRKYVAFLTDDDGQHVSGEVNRSNFEEVRNMMLQLNYLNLDKDTKEAHYTSDKAKELWERAQGFLKIEQDDEKEDRPEYRLGNIISKLCSINPAYTYNNVKDLTIFQLYDAFFQASYMRSIALNERIFSNHGGDKFNYSDWLKPITKNI